MNRPARVIATTLGGVFAIGVAVTLVASARWNRRTARIVDTMRAGTSPPVQPAVTTYDPSRQNVPAPVARFFSFALQPGQRLVRGARVAHRGTFAMQPDVWTPFTSEQHFQVRSPAFVWNAKIGMAPIPSLLSVHVRDSYLGGEGAIHAAVAALVPVADQHGTPELAAGSLARYLAESVWFPTALLAGDAGAGVNWSPIDDRSARATLRDGNVTVSADFHFGARGEIVRISGERYHDVKGTGFMTPWEVHLREYSRRNGMMVPAVGEVAWLLPEGRHAYWRGRITSIDYEWR